MNVNAVDLLVRCGNPVAFDAIMRQIGPFVLVGGPDDFKVVEGCYVLRCFNNVGYAEFAIKNQGYGEVVRRLQELK